MQARQCDTLSALDQDWRVSLPKNNKGDDERFFFEYIVTLHLKLGRTQQC